MFHRLKPMQTNAEGTTEQQNKYAIAKRNYGLDNLKMVLCLIVVAVHTMIPYTNINIAWYFSPELPNEYLEKHPLVNFLEYCGMSIFFIISGYFVPTSYDKQGFKTFLWKKTKHLLIPAFAILAICIICTPYPMYHIWFLQMLFLFNLAYALFRLITGWRIKEGQKMELSLPFLIGYFILICVTNLIVRQKFYVCHFTVLFNVFQIEPAKVTEYILTFLFGIIARRFNWFWPHSKKLVIEICIIVLITFIIKELRITEYNYIGSRLHTILESSFCLFGSLLIIWGFNKFLNMSNKLIAILSENSMTIFLIHMPILYYVQTYTKMWNIYFPLKLWLIILFVIAVSFLISYLLRKNKFIRNFI